MKQWYLTRQGIKGATHRGEELEANKYVLMSSKQADSHNKRLEVLSKTNPPEDGKNCQFSEEWQLWQKLQDTEVKTKKASDTVVNYEVVEEQPITEDVKVDEA